MGLSGPAVAWFPPDKGLQVSEATPVHDCQWHSPAPASCITDDPHLPVPVITHSHKWVQQQLSMTASDSPAPAGRTTGDPHPPVPVITHTEVSTATPVHDCQWHSPAPLSCTTGNLHPPVPVITHTGEYSHICLWLLVTQLSTTKLYNRWSTPSCTYRHTHTEVRTATPVPHCQWHSQAPLSCTTGDLHPPVPFITHTEVSTATLVFDCQWQSSAPAVCTTGDPHPPAYLSSHTWYRWAQPHLSMTVSITSQQHQVIQQVIHIFFHLSWNLSMHIHTDVQRKKTSHCNTDCMYKNWSINAQNTHKSSIHDCIMHFSLRKHRHTIPIYKKTCSNMLLTTVLRIQSKMACVQQRSSNICTTPDMKYPGAQCVAGQCLAPECCEGGRRQCLGCGPHGHGAGWWWTQASSLWAGFASVWLSDAACTGSSPHLICWTSPPAHTGCKNKKLKNANIITCTGCKERHHSST